ncbi:hypothetical protein CHARACLAT_027161 [Characodon lateralis]|uniref:Uncharacterized protein n=1 Tax=Characodon lateralis TaxID=208331 RepID=A0ABU7EMN9_9TELE|nr:hypothetical protein [Characodon lateralis]
MLVVLTGKNLSKMLPLLWLVSSWRPPSIDKVRFGHIRCYCTTCKVPLPLRGLVKPTQVTNAAYKEEEFGSAASLTKLDFAEKTSLRLPPKRTPDWLHWCFCYGEMSYLK